MCLKKRDIGSKGEEERGGAGSVEDFFCTKRGWEKAWTSIDKSFERVYSIRGRITSLILKN
jgi:hypothetical protein